jgi:hypothetical protein
MFYHGRGGREDNTPLLAWGPLLVAVTAAYYRRRTRATRHVITTVAPSLGPGR